MKNKTQKRKSYAQIINPIHHLERTVIRLDKENDRLQKRVVMLSMVSVLLALLSVLLVIVWHD